MEKYVSKEVLNDMKILKANYFLSCARLSLVGVDTVFIEEVKEQIETLTSVLRDYVKGV